MEYTTINRDGYLDRITRMFGRGCIVALTGQRRVGKSFLMKEVINNIAKTPQCNVIYINKESTEFDEIVTYKELDNYVATKLVEDKENYLFIDEVQEIKEFQKALLSLLTNNKCQIMITGSNAKMLSGELATNLRGRYIEYKIGGLSYNEFLRFHNVEDNDESLRRFLNVGGLPQLRLFGLENNELVEDYLFNVYDTIVLRDVVERENIRNIPLLRSLVKFLADNIGKLFSVRSIVNFLKGQRTETSASVIVNYLECLCNAFIINRVERFDIHGKKIFEIGDKFYFDDLGIRNIIVGSNRNFDIEKVIENAVYRHIVRLGYKVYVGQMHNTEIDFVAQKDGETAYVQVTYLLASEETIAREFGNLKLIKDNYHKYVVSMDLMYHSVNDNGIRHIYLRDFLKLTTL